MNLHGTRSVQKVVEVCRSTPAQVSIVVAALRDATVALCLDTNGNHVVQRLLQYLGPGDNAFVFEVRTRQRNANIVGSSSVPRGFGCVVRFSCDHGSCTRQNGPLLCGENNNNNNNNTSSATEGEGEKRGDT